MLSKDKFSVAYERGFDSTVRFLVSRGVPCGRAEEIAQAAWVKGWRKRGQVRQPSQVISWINTIGLNIFRNLLRRDRRNRELVEIAVPPRVNHGLIDISRAMRRCRKSERRLLEWHYVQGYSSKEIAEHCGCTPGAVRVRMLRARRNLKLYLTGGEPSSATAH